MYRLGKYVTSRFGSGQSALFPQFSVHSLFLHIRIESGFGIEQYTDDDDHHDAHYDGARREQAVVELRELVIHEVLQHVQVIERIITREKIYLSEYLK
jgi:hypothetical protein